MQTEERFYKLYSLDTELKHYLNIDGVPYEIDVLSQSQSFEDAEPEKNEEEIIDGCIKTDFLDDIESPENISTEELSRRIKRYQKIVNYLKKKYGYKCQLCGATFLMDNGKYYCEAHHIKMLSKGGSQEYDNVIILCANHHREFHYASNTIVVGELLGNKRVISVGNKEYIVAFG